MHVMTYYFEKPKRLTKHVEVSPYKNKITLVTLALATGSTKLLLTSNFSIALEKDFFLEWFTAHPKS